jgi:hypothetical protein
MATEIPVVKRFEYRMEKMKGEQTVGWMNKLGNDGWELTGVASFTRDKDYCILFFKREIQF